MVKHLVWQHLRRPKFGRDHLRVDLVSVLPCNVPSHGVVASKGSMAEGTWDPDSLVSLSDVSAKVGFITIGSLAERAFKFCS